MKFSRGSIVATAASAVVASAAGGVLLANAGGADRTGPPLAVSADAAPQAQRDLLPADYLRGREDLKLRLETSRLAFQSGSDKVWYVEGGAMGRDLRCLATQTGTAPDLVFSTSCIVPEDLGSHLGTLQEDESGPALVVGFVPDGFTQITFGGAPSQRTIRVSRNIVAFRAAASDIPASVVATGTAGRVTLKVTS